MVAAVSELTRHQEPKTARRTRDERNRRTVGALLEAAGVLLPICCPARCHFAPRLSPLCVIPK
jgi:hypothetical protein